MIYPQTTFPFELCDLSSEPPEGDSSKLSGNACYGNTIWLSFFSRKRDFPGRSVIQALLLAARRRWL
jgi:hypothetical protein